MVIGEFCQKRGSGHENPVGTQILAFAAVQCGSVGDYVQQTSYFLVLFELPFITVSNGL